MVTGAYFPETSGASLQCQQLVRLLSGRAEFTILTTTTDTALPGRAIIEGVDVWRVPVDPASGRSKAAATARFASILSSLRHRFEIVHLHGFSQKTLLVVALARLWRKRILIKLTSVGHDDAASMRSRGLLAYAMYRQADRFVGISPRFEDEHRRAGLPPDRFRFVPNGVDLQRFRPATADQRRAARLELGLPPDDPIVLFVGFFSHEKRPDLLYEAWRTLHAGGLPSTLVLIGSTNPAYYEIDPGMAEAIRSDAASRGLLPRLVFVERTTAIENYYRAADVFALPTLREGLPNVVLESMASGVPPVVTALPGVTDWIVDPSNGVLIAPNDRVALERALEDLLRNPHRRQEMSHAARESVSRRFAADTMAEHMLRVYGELSDNTPSAPVP
jgi:glycosyltransferase involved in cell wall biosynthesis